MVTKSSTLQQGGVLPGVEPEEFTLIRAGSEVGRYDTSYVAVSMALRWLILLAYVVLAGSGAIPMSAAALALSAGWICAANLVSTWVWIQKRRIAWYDNTYLFVDALAIAFAVLASGNLSYPIWMAYVMVMASGAAEQAKKFSLSMVAFCLGTYFADVAIFSLAGWALPSAGIIAVTALLLFFIGANLIVTFDGNRRLRAYIRKMSVTDPLTGLANRRRLTEALANPPATEYSIAVAVLDVDNFKQYNDSYGHLAGDQLLVKLAKSLTEAFPAAHIISRYGGDEFVVLFPCTSTGDAEERALKLVNGSGGPSDRRRADRVPVSVGVALWPHHEVTLDGALAAADDCLRLAKRSKKGTVVTVSSPAAQALAGGDGAR